MKKVFAVFLLLFFISVFAVKTFASDEGFRFGMQLSHESISKTVDINGGSYISVNGLFSFNPSFTVKLKYATDISPNSLSDNLLGVSPQFIFGKKGATIHPYLELVYLSNLSRTDATYYGIKFCAVSSGRYQSSGSDSMVTIDVLPVGYLYNSAKNQSLVTVELLSVGIYF